MEVVISLGILAFAFVALLGLIPGGLSRMDAATDATVKSQILQQVANMARQASFQELRENGLDINPGVGEDPKHPLWENADYYFDEQAQLLTNTATQKTKYVYKAAVKSTVAPIVPTAGGAALPLGAGRDTALVNVYITRKSAPNLLYSYSVIVADNGLTPNLGGN